MGTHFTIVTNQKSLKFLKKQKLTEEQFKWASKLIGLDFDIKYRPGNENTVADLDKYFSIFSFYSPKNGMIGRLKYKRIQSCTLSCRTCWWNLLLTNTMRWRMGGYTTKANLFCLGTMVQCLLTDSTFESFIWPRSSFSFEEDNHSIQSWKRESITRRKGCYLEGIEVQFMPGPRAE